MEAEGCNWADGYIESHEGHIDQESHEGRAS